MRPGSLEKNDRSMRRSRESSSLREQSPVYQRDREVSVGLPLDDDRVVDAIVSDGEALDVDLEILTLAKEAE